MTEYKVTAKRTTLYQTVVEAENEREAQEYLREMLAKQDLPECGGWIEDGPVEAVTDEAANPGIDETPLRKTGWSA